MPNNLGEVVQEVRQDEKATNKERIIEDFAAKVKKARKEKGWSLHELSYISNLSVNTIVNIENGCKNIPKENTVQIIANALELRKAKETLKMLEILKQLEVIEKKNMKRVKYEAITPLAKLIRAERMKRNMSIVEFSKACGIGYNTSYRIEYKGLTPTLETLNKIAKFIQKDVKELTKLVIEQCSNATQIGKEIRKQRTEKGLSMEELGKMTGVALNTIWRVETGVTRKPRKVVLISLAKVLDLKEY